MAQIITKPFLDGTLPLKLYGLNEWQTSYQWPVFGIDAHGSIGASAVPA